MTWRCPNCGHQDIEVEYVQPYAVQMVIEDGAVVGVEPYEAAKDKREIIQVLCLHCNMEDNDDKYWHMTETEFAQDLEAREADYLYDLSRDT